MVSDIQLLDLFDGRDRADIVERESVTCVHGESGRSGVTRRCGERPERPGRRGRVGIRAGVQFDGVGPEHFRRGDGGWRWIDKETGANAGRPQPPDASDERGGIAAEIESALRRDLFAPFRHERHLIRAHALGNREHLCRAGHLQVEWRAEPQAQRVHVRVVHMPPVLAEMRGNAVGAGGLARQGGRDGIGLGRAPRLPKRGDVIDVDIEANRSHGAARCADGIGRGEFVRASSVGRSRDVLRRVATCCDVLRRVATCCERRRR